MTPEVVAMMILKLVDSGMALYKIIRDSLPEDRKAALDAKAAALNAEWQNLAPKS
jgi:hypothetical protein